MIPKLLRQMRHGFGRLPKTRLSKVWPAASKTVDTLPASSNDGNQESSSRSDAKIDPIGRPTGRPKADQETNPASESNLRRLLVFNSFTKSKHPATASGEQICVSNGNATGNRLLARAYICGPTVYDDSHIGHAMTYLRFDLIRRVLSAYCSVDLGAFSDSPLKAFGAA